MLDTNTILERVRSGAIPPDWTVYHARKSYYIVRGLGLVVLAGVCLGALILIVAVSSPEDLANLWLVIALLGSACIGLASWASAQFAAIRSVNQQFLVLTPDVILEHKLERSSHDFAAFFDQLADMRMKAYGSRGGNVSIVLVLTFANGAERGWWVDRRFGPSVAIAQRIIEAYSCYVREHTSEAGDPSATFNKLVRDRIPEIIHRNGDECETRILTEENYRAALREKLIEEACEVAKAPRNDLITELADVREVLDALMRAYDIEDSAVEAEKARRREERGGFDERVRLLSVKQKPEQQPSHPNGK